MATSSKPMPPEEPHTDRKPARQSIASQSRVAAVQSAEPQTVYLRDGELVLYRRSRSLLYQCRYKLSDGRWVRQTTGKAALEHAITRACDIYDEARYRQRLGLAHRAHSFAQIAAICATALRQEIDGRARKSSLNDYLSIIERYFVPYFGERQLEQLTHGDIREFEAWRDRQMARKPKHSTQNNFACAWNRVLATAVERGFISDRAPVPKLTVRGERGKTRPAFSREEIDRLLPFMEQWQYAGRRVVEQEIRPLLRDYVEVLLYTGMRHGTEAMGLRWRDLEWHTKDGVRYLRVWVDGKTGGRWLIAKHAAVAVFERLHARQKDLNGVTFEEMLTIRASELVFRFSDGYQPHSLAGTFRNLMRDSGLMKDGAGQTRTEVPLEFRLPRVGGHAAMDWRF